MLDGTLLPIDRIAADRPFYSGKHKKHGMNVQVLADPAGPLLWASPALPGAVHDIRAAPEHGILDALASADIDCWADKGYQGAGPAVRVPYRGRWANLSEGQQAVNRSQAEVEKGSLSLGVHARSLEVHRQPALGARCPAGRDAYDGRLHEPVACRLRA